MFWGIGDKCKGGKEGWRSGGWRSEVGGVDIMDVYPSLFAGTPPGKDKDWLGKDKDFQVYS